MGLLMWALAAFILYCYIVRLPNPEFWEWITG